MRLSAILATMLLAACMDTGTMGPQQGSGDAQLAILNGLGTGDQAQLTLDGVVMGMPNWGTTTSTAIAPGSHRIEIRSFGSATLLASADFAVPAGERRSAVIGGATGKNVVVLVRADTASLPPVGAAKVRMVHTVPKAPIFDAYLTLVGLPADSSARIVAPFEYGSGLNAEFPGYVVRGPGTYQATLKLTGTTQVVLQSPTFSMAAGQVYSVIVSENAAGALEMRAVREK